MAPTPVYKVAILLYPYADILDIAGPAEIFTTTQPGPVKQPFTVTTFAQATSVPAAKDPYAYTPTQSFAAMRASMADFDILVIPGAAPDILDTLIPSAEGKEIFELIRCFNKLPPRPETGVRILQSICTGALLLAAAGVLAGRKVTTHHLSYDRLKKLADQAAGGDSHIEIERGRRWVDGGVDKEGVRLVTAGGISSGLDASLWVVEQLLGKEASDWIANIVEFERRQGWGVHGEGAK